MDTMKHLPPVRTLQLSTFLEPITRRLFQHSSRWTGARSPQSIACLRSSCFNIDPTDFGHGHMMTKAFFTGSLQSRWTDHTS